MHRGNILALQEIAHGSEGQHMLIQFGELALEVATIIGSLAEETLDNNPHPAEGLPSDFQANTFNGVPILMAGSMKEGEEIDRNLAVQTRAMARKGKLMGNSLCEK